MSDLRDKYATRNYSFYQDGIEITRYSHQDCFELHLYQEDLNRMFIAKVTKDILDPFNCSLLEFVKLLDETYDESNQCSFDFKGLLEGKKITMEIYETIYYETLLSIEFVPSGKY